MKEAEVFAALKKKYKGLEWALLRHVPDQTGYGKKRTADAIAMNLWPSRGLAIHGFEIKVDRRDWLSELHNPEKAEAIARYCDYWWVIISDEGVALVEEIPETWGLQVVTGSGTRVLKEAAKNDRAPASVSREFLAALLRRAEASDETVDKAVLAEAEAAAFRRGQEDTREQAEQVVRAKLTRLSHLEDEFEKFREVMGSEPGQFPGLYGQALNREFLEGLKAYLNLRIDVKKARNAISATGRDLESAMVDVRRALDTLDGAGL